MVSILQLIFLQKEKKRIRYFRGKKKQFRADFTMLFIFILFAIHFSLGSQMNQEFDGMFMEGVGALDEYEWRCHITEIITFVLCFYLDLFDKVFQMSQFIFNHYFIFFLYTCYIFPL